MLAMRLHNLLALVLLVACDSGPSKQESAQIFGSVWTALSNGESAAIAAAPNHSPEPQLEWSGPCSLGGTLTLSGAYESGDVDTDASGSFDLRSTFTGCKEAAGTFDGELRWSSIADANMYAWTMDGTLAWVGHDGSGSCDFDLTMTFSEGGISYDGSVCGNTMTAVPGH
jgi:hypothetical protein